MAKNPVTIITVDDPRAYGRIIDPGWEKDIPFADEDGKNAGWDLKGCEYLPSLKGIAPKGKIEPADMALADWRIISGKWDAQERPSGYPRKKFLAMYDGGPNPAGRIISHANWRLHWAAAVVCYTPPAENTLPSCNFSFKMWGGGLGLPQWRLIVPTVVSGDVEDDLRGPELRFTPYGTAYGQWADLPGFGSSYVVSRHKQDTTTGMNSGVRRYLITCELTCNQWLINILSEGQTEPRQWVYEIPGVDVGNPLLNDGEGQVPICAPGPLEFQTQGQQALVNIMPIQYEAYSEASLTTTYHTYRIDADFGKTNRATDPLTADAVMYAPAGTAYAVGVTTDADNAVLPQVQMFTNGTIRPVCGTVSARLSAVIGDVATAPWVSTGQNVLEGKIKYTRRAKGSSLRFAVRDATAALKWNGNNVVTLEAGHQEDGGTPTLRKLITAYLVTLTRGLDGAEEGVIDCEAVDFGDSRLNHRRAIFSASYGGLLFPDAFRMVGNRLGFTADRILVTGFATTYLPTSQVIGEPAFAWGPRDGWQEVLDGLCKAVGATWGIDSEGRLYAKPNLVYSGTPDYVLDAVGTGRIQIKSETADFVNNIYVITGKGKEQQIGWARNKASEGTADDRNFVGDMIQDVETDEKNFASAQAQAEALLGKRLRFQQQLIWTPLVAQALDPGMFVQYTPAAAGLPANSIWLTVQEDSEIDQDEPSELGWQQTITMVRV